MGVASTKNCAVHDTLDIGNIRISLPSVLLLLSCVCIVLVQLVQNEQKLRTARYRKVFALEQVVLQLQIRSAVYKSIYFFS